MVDTKPEKTCSVCNEQKPADMFGIDHRNGGPKYRCKECDTHKQREWRRNKPDYEKERYARFKPQTRERHLVRKYGVDLPTYSAMLRAQDGRCAICGAAEAEQFKGVLHVDHCHDTGEVRGLLCRGCNHMLGVVKDDPEVLQKAIAYLMAPPGKPTPSVFD